MTDLAALLFAVLTASLAAFAGVMVHSGLRRRDPLRLSFAVIVLRFAGAAGYESWALATGLALTISTITALALDAHPIAWVLVFVALTAAAGGLSWHFVSRAGHTRWWVLVLGAAACIGGGLLAWWAGWLP